MSLIFLAKTVLAGEKEKEMASNWDGQSQFGVAKISYLSQVSSDKRSMVSRGKLECIILPRDGK